MSKDKVASSQQKDGGGGASATTSSIKQREVPQIKAKVRPGLNDILPKELMNELLMESSGRSIG